MNNRNKSNNSSLVARSLCAPCLDEAIQLMTLLFSLRAIRFTKYSYSCSYSTSFISPYPSTFSHPTIPTLHSVQPPTPPPRIHGHCRLVALFQQQQNNKNISSPDVYLPRTYIRRQTIRADKHSHNHIWCGLTAYETIRRC